MRLELRTTRKGDKAVPRGLVCVAESKRESGLLDRIFGAKVGEDGLIGVRRCECRLSDGFGEHYVYIKAEPEAKEPPLKKAAELLRFNAGLIRESSTAGTEGTDWSGEEEAEADYRELMATAQALDEIEDEEAWWRLFVKKRSAELHV